MVTMPRPTDNEINDVVDAWHDTATSLTLPEWLGWTEGEYTAWVSDPDIVPDRPLKDQPNAPHH
jgi:hypothetical protein